MQAMVASVSNHAARDRDRVGSAGRMRNKQLELDMSYVTESNLTDIARERWSNGFLTAVVRKSLGLTLVSKEIARQSRLRCESENCVAGAGETTHRRIPPVRHLQDGANGRSHVTNVTQFLRTEILLSRGSAIFQADEPPDQSARPASSGPVVFDRRALFGRSLDPPRKPDGASAVNRSAI
jgi:hypothetical protein